MCEIVPGKVYSRTIKFSDVNYRDAERDAKKGIFDSYAQTLNLADPKTELQITVQNRRLDMSTLEKKLFYPMQDDSYDTYRREVNQILVERVQSGQSELVREKYITFAVRDENQSAAMRGLVQMENTLISKLKNTGCSEVATLTGAQRMELLHSIIRPEEPFDFHYRTLALCDGLDTRDYLAPDSFSFAEKRSFEFGPHYGQVLVAKEYERNLTDQILDKLSELQMELVLTIHIRIMDQSEALNLVQEKISFMDSEQANASRKAVQQGFSPELAMSYEFKHRYEEAVGLFNDLQSMDQKLFKVTLLVYTWANSPETLAAKTSEICRTSRGLGITLMPLDYRQMEGFNSILPIGSNYVSIERSLPTASTAILIPFTNQELMQPGGISYGINTHSGNLILFDRTTMVSGNGMILGVPGGGKSFAAKQEMVNILLRDENAQIFVIDPEQEYAALTKALGGSYIHISPGSSEHLNPMDITVSYGDDEDPIKLKASFIQSICSTLMHGYLTPQHRSLISRACIDSYRKYFSAGGKREPPTLLDFYNILCSFEEPQAEEIALALELYVKGALSVFASPTNVETDARIVSYDIRDLGTELKTMGMLVVLDQIWNKLTRNREQRTHTYIYIDEFQLLLTNEYSSNFFFELWSRARKYGGICTGITQNVQTLLETVDGKRMLSNSLFVLALKQNAQDRDSLSQILGLSPEQGSALTSAEAGQGLLCAGGTGGIVVPFTNRIPTDSQLYRLITTKLDEQIIT